MDKNISFRNYPFLLILAEHSLRIPSTPPFKASLPVDPAEGEGPRQSLKHKMLEYYLLFAPKISTGYKSSPLRGLMQEFCPYIYIVMLMHYYFTFLQK